MARDPVGDLLGARRLGVGVVRGAEDGDEELDLDHLAGGGVDEAGLLARVVDEALLAGVVDLAHRQAPALQPAPVDLAELGVAVAVGVLLQVLQVEQLERDAGLAPLGVQDARSRARADGALGGRRRPVQAGLQRLVARAPRPAAQSSPAARARRSTPETVPRPTPRLLGHLPVAPPQGPLLSQDLADLPHG